MAEKGVKPPGIFRNPYIPWEHLPFDVHKNRDGLKPMTLTTSPYGEVLEEPVKEEVKRALTQVLTPQVITKRDVERYFRKALINKSWRKLEKTQRVLLWLARKVVDTVKSPLLKKALSEIFLKIELASLKGKLVFYGLLSLLRKGVKIGEIVKKPVTLLYEGLKYLDNPLILEPPNPEQILLN